MTYCNSLAAIDAKRLDEILSAFFLRWEAASAAVAQNPVVLQKGRCCGKLCFYSRAPEELFS
jgi:hypothetical protein